MPDLQQRDAAALSERHAGLARVEAFSDGVFAFAATLLVLGIRIPRPDDVDAAAGESSVVRACGPSDMSPHRD
jgi:uncharacterized membrane protein